MTEKPPIENKPPSKENNKPNIIRLKTSSVRTHADTALMVEVLLNVEEGAVITYSELEKWVTYPVQRGVGYSRLKAARDIVCRDHGRVFEAEVGVGLRCLNDSDKSLLPDRTIRSVRRKVKKTHQKVSTIKDVNNLSDKEKQALNTGMAQMALIEMTASKSANKAIAKDLEKEGREITNKNTLDILKGLIP